MALGSGLLNFDRPLYHVPDGFFQIFERIHHLAQQDTLKHQPVLSMLGLQLLALLCGPRDPSTNRAARALDH